MKKFCFLIIVAGAFLCLPRVSYSQQQRWKEVKRYVKKNKPESYSDTTYLLGNLSEPTIMMMRGSMAYKAEIKRDRLIFQDRTLKVIQSDEQQIEVEGEDGLKRVYQLIPKNTEYSGILNTFSLNAPIEQLNTQLLQGKWESYKQQWKTPSEAKQINYNKLIKTIFIEVKDDVVSGYAFVTKMSEMRAENYLYQIVGSNQYGLIVKTVDGMEHKLTIYQQSATELILSDDDGMLYYLKKF